MAKPKQKRTRQFSEKFLDDFIAAWEGRFEDQDGATRFCPIERRELTNGEVVFRDLASKNPAQFASLAAKVFSVTTPREEVKEVGENLASILENMNRREVDMGRVINGSSYEQRRIKDH